MTHIANLFIGESLQGHAEDVLKNVFAQYETAQYISKFCRFYHLCCLEGKQIMTKLNATERLEFDEVDVERESTTLEDDNQVMGFWIKEHTEMVTVGTVTGSAELKIFVFVNLAETADCDLAIKMVDVLKTIKNRQFKVNFVGYDYDLVRDVFKQEGAIVELENICKASKKQLVDFDQSSAQGIKGRFFVIQNSAMNGAAYDLDYTTLNTIVSEFLLAALENYDRLFPVTVQPGKVTGIGLSMISLDKVYFVRYLMRRAYLKVLNDEGIEQKTVSREVLDSVIQNILRKDVNIFSDFYDRHIKPLVEQKKTKEQIVAAINPQIDQYFYELEKRLTAFLDNDSETRKEDGSPMTIHEKQAALALLLGIDDKLIAGSSFEDDILTIDDAMSGAALQLVGDNNQLVNKVYDDDGHPRLYPGPIKNPLDDERRAIYPLPRIKQLKRNILETSENIRKWEKQLESMEVLEEAGQQSKRRLTKDGFVYDDVRYRLLGKVIQEPLAEIYDPCGVDIKKSIDLRSAFTPVKDQGEAGSCTIFAITAIYEYLLKKIKAGDPDLSERFVFYNTCVKNNKPQGGASFKDVLDSIANYGICNEDDCPYSRVADDLREEPTEDAFKKALTHRITEAKMVEVNHAHITAALSQGYPVAVGLKVFDSFGKGYKGYELTPQKDEIDTGNYEYHSMVICGYSEEDSIYIVRNSWGTKFGDDGYCYLPFSYIDDPTLNSFCCIVTKTEDGEVKGLPKSLTKVDLIKEDLGIQNILLKIKIDESKRKIERLLNEDRSNQILYMQLVHNLETTDVRKKITEGMEAKLAERIRETKERESKLRANFTTEMNETRRQYDKWIFYCSICSLVLILISGFAWYKLPGECPTWIISGISALAVIATILFIVNKKHAIDKRRMDLNEQLASLKLAVSSLEREKTVVRLKHHLASVIIDKIADLKARLTKRYNLVVSYVGNLQTWYYEEKQNMEKMDSERHIPVIGIIDNKTLDGYFELHGDEILGDIRFSDFIADYDMSDENIIEYRNSLRGKIIERLLKVVEHFNIMKFLDSPSTFQYVDANNMKADTVIPRLDSLSLPFMQCNDVVGGFQPSVALLYNGSENANTNSLVRYFTNPPTFITMKAENKLVAISTIEIEEFN